MSLWNVADIKSALKNDIINEPDSNQEIDKVIIDSREKTNNGLFVAISGENNDGHNFLSQVFENGAKLAIVEKISPEFEKDPRLILVKDSFKALHSLAIYARNRSEAKIIAITGSAGKTSIKEMLKTTFSSQGKTYATSGNFNNHFGLPLTFCNLPKNCEYAIIEMGTSSLGEIETLSNITKPHIAIISNVSAAHIGNFKNEKEIALEKSMIFSGLVNNGHIIINNDNHHIQTIKEQSRRHKVNPDNIITVGKKSDSNIKLDSYSTISNELSQVNVTLQPSNEKTSYQVNSINESIIFNSLTAIASLKILGKNFQSGIKSLETLETPLGRGNIINMEQLTIIDDSYNANLASVISSLKFLSNLKKQHPESRTVAILGDMLELGDLEVQEHQKIAQYIKEYNIDKVLLVGKLMKNVEPILSKNIAIGHYQNSDDLSNKIISYLENKDLIVVKGSRGMRMEKIINKIKSKYK